MAKKPSLEISQNPKDLAARQRVNIALLPSSGIIHGAMACMDGAQKYGQYNFREEKISFLGYISAIQRHSLDLIDGEDYASDSLCHHLGHIIATASILIDAIENDCVIDDRPKKGRASAILEKAKETLAARAGMGTKAK